MPSGAKKRKAAKKKNLQQSTHSHGEDELKHYDEKESDGGEISSPAYRDESGHPFDKREEVESGKREGSSSAQLIVPESNSVEKEDTQKVATEEEGGVQIEWDLKLEEDYKSKNISIESAEVHGGKLTSSSSSSSGSSSSSSDDESHDVENETDVVGTGLVVDSVEPVETGQVVESVELVKTLPEVASQVIENGKVEENDDKVFATCSSVKLDDSLLSTVNQVIDDSLLSIVNQVSDSIPARETDNRVAEAVQVVDLAEPTDCSSEVVYEVNDTISSGETRNGDDETARLVETEKDSLMEETVEVIDSALTENHNTSCVVELYLPEVTEKEILTLDISNAVAPELVDLGSENKELPTSEKAEVCSDAKDPATDVQEDKLELSYNSHVGHTSNGAELVTNYQNPEYSSNQPPVASTSQAVQKTSMKSCCGLFELFTSSDR